MEARTGFEPVKNGVADRRISSLPPGHKKTRRFRSGFFDSTEAKTLPNKFTEARKLPGSNI